MTSAPASLPPSRGLQAALLALVAGVLIVLSVGSLWSESADLAHHYALVARLSEFWGLPPGADPSLGEMNVYPRTSHALAALVGSVFDSPLVGLLVVALAAVVVLWASLVHLLMSLPGRLATRCLVMFAVLVVLNRLEWRFELHGRELVGSFFYAQLVAQALVAATLVALLALERGGAAAWVRYLACIGLAWVAAGMHALPALQLLSFFLLLAGLDALLRWRDGAPHALRGGLVAAAFMVGAVALLVRHPAFSAMVEISRTNGAFTPRHFAGIGAIGAYAAVLAAASGLVLRQWWRARRADAAGGLLAIKLIGLYGLAVAGLCVAQILALRLGYGSEYAIKKHVFALNSVALLELSLLPALWAIRREPAAATASAPPRGVVFAYLLLPALTVMAFYGIAPRKKTHGTAAIVTLERALLRERDALRALAPGGFAYVLPGPGVSPPLAYLLTTGVLASPRGPGSNSESILRAEPLGDWGEVAAVLQPGPLQPDQPESCRRAFPSVPIAVLDGPCMARAVAQTRTLIRFTAAQAPSPCTLLGFGDPEGSFTWTVQPEASLECPVPRIDGKPATRVTLSAGAFLDRVPFQRARVTVEGGGSAELRFDEAVPYQSVTLDLPATAGDTCRIRLSLPDATSPSAVGLSVDPRILGLSLARIEFK